MAGQRGFVGRSRDDLFAAAESVNEMLVQLKGMNWRGGRGGPSPHHQAEWRPDLPSRQDGKKMAGQRGFVGRSQDNLYAAEESDDEVPAHYTLKGMNHRGGRRGAGPPHHTQKRPAFSSQREWAERPRNPEEARWRGRNRGRPGSDWHPRNHYLPDPSTQKELPWEPAYGPRDRQHNRSDQRQQPLRDPANPATVQQLVMALTQSPNFSISLLNLLEHHDLSPQQVRRIVTHHGHLFHLQEEVVSLAPRLKLCTAHSSSSGCQNREVCDSLHMCPKYVLGWCSENVACVLGHRWHTDHNLAILKRLSLEYVRYRVLHDLLRKGEGRGRGGQHAAGPLDVCQAYNGAGCDQLQCPNLHVCLSFVVGFTTCTRDNCQLNHDLLSPACCHLLKLHRLPINEAPRDVVMALLQANPSLKDKADASPSAKPRPTKAAGQGQARKGGKDKGLLQQPGHRKNQGLAKEESEESSSSATETESETDDSQGKGKKKRGVKESRASKAKAGVRDRHDQGKRVSNSSGTGTDSEVADNHPDKGKGHDNKGKLLTKQRQKDGSQSQRLKEAPKPAPRRTLWAHYLHGDVTVPQICYYSVESMCRDEESGCPKLHAITHFHWQVKDQDSRWINLRPDQVTCIERAFCDPALNGVNLPRIDPSKLDASVSGLFLLLGRDTWQADFLTSSLANSTKNKKLQLRRLCTEPIVGQPIKASTYHWYFLDINKKWVKYGDMDTAGNQALVSSITSADIENHYLKTPQQPLTFKNSKFTFVLDVISMKQTNQSTNMSREVRRRPEPHLPQEEDKTKAASDLPPHWDAMQPEERSRLVTLGPTSEEYKKVVGLLGTNVAATNVVKIERIQNPFMWRALQNKIKDMTALYKDASVVNVQQLFHGTYHTVVASICNENFDWRLHGSSTGQACGRGTYFGTDSGISYGYCRPDPNGLKHMFVARVAVGSMTIGNSSMVRPPINPATSMPYDSTVDNTTNPRMIIKYTTQEYYPEYLLTLT